MNRDGFALLAVLWVIAALAGIVGLGVGLMRVDALAAANRLQLERARWGAEACLAIVESRWVEHHVVDTATVNLGRTTTCHWRVDDPTSRVNVNTAALPMLVSLGMDPATVNSLIAHRPYQDTAELRSRLGADSGLLSWLTVDGSGTINLNAAPSQVLKSIPGIGAQAIEALAEYDRLGRPVASLDQLVSVTPGNRTTLLAHYADLSSLVTFAPTQLIITATGWVGDGEPHATVEELVVPLADRLAVIRRRLW